MTKIAAAVSERSSASTCQAGNSLRRPEGHRPEESINIQGTKARYALGKQRDMTMITATASEAVKGVPLWQQYETKKYPEQCQGIFLS